MLFPGILAGDQAGPVEIDEGRHFAIDEVQAMIGAGTLTCCSRENGRSFSRPSEHVHELHDHH